MTDRGFTQLHVSGQSGVSGPLPSLQRGSEGQGWWEKPCGSVLNDRVLPTDSDDGDT